MKELIFDEAIKHLSKDNVLKSVIDKVRLPKRTHNDDVYLGLLNSIISQQLSVKAAATIYGRFLDLFDEQYPDAKDLLALNNDQLRGVGLSGQKSKYVKNVAHYFQEHNLFDRDWTQDSDEEVISLLTEIKGVGRWTVQMILMFVLLRQDVLPVLDLGIQQGIKLLYGIEAEKKALFAKMEEVAAPWKPYRSAACLYLWAAKDA
ncbi:MAG: DNA-3-methyladenine glycosylase 2 family protein [Bacteroidota bacterium]